MTSTLPAPTSALRSTHRAIANPGTPVGDMALANAGRGADIGPFPNVGGKQLVSVGKPVVRFRLNVFHSWFGALSGANVMNVHSAQRSM
jgi:hypothetical protein